MEKLSTIKNITQNYHTLSIKNDNIFNTNSTTTIFETFKIPKNKLSRFPYEIIIKILLYTDLQTSMNFSSLCHRFRSIGIPFSFIQKALLDKDLALFKSNSFLEYLYRYYTKPSFINYIINHIINHIQHCSFLFSKEQLKNLYESVKSNQYRFSDFSFNNNCCIIRSAEIGDERLFRFFLSQDPYHYPVLLASTCSTCLNLVTLNKIDNSLQSVISSNLVNTYNNENLLFHSQKKLIHWTSPDMSSKNIFYTAYTQNKKFNFLPILNCIGKEYCYRCCSRCGLLIVDEHINMEYISYSFFCRCKHDASLLGDEKKKNLTNTSINTSLNTNNSNDVNDEENHCSIPGCNCWHHKNKEEKVHEHEEENDIIQLSKGGKHICINTSDKNDRAFCQACANGHIEIVKLLLSITHPRVVNTQAHNNYAIINAASNGHVEVVKLLLSLEGDRKVDISSNDHAAFVWACCYGHLDVVKELIKEPNINTQAQNNSAFIWACNNGKLEVVKLLLSLKGKLAVDPIAQGNRAIVSACSMGNIQIVETLLHYGENEDNGSEGIIKVDPTVNNNQAFITACSNGSLEIIKMLLALEGERAINPIDQNNEAFINACTNGHQEIVQLLLGLKGKYEVDPAAQDNKAFIRACSYGNLNIVRLLLSLPLSKGIDPTAQQNLAFINACLCGYYDIVKELLILSHIHFCCVENDIQKNNINNNKTCSTIENTQLYTTTIINSTSSVDNIYPILSENENIEGKCSSCENIIIKPVSVPTSSISKNDSAIDMNKYSLLLTGEEKSISKKILKPINPNDRDNQAFIEACSYGQEKVVKLLLSLKDQYRVDPSAQNYQALIKAAINGHQNVVKLILSINDDRKISEKEPIETSIRLVNDYNYSQKQNYQTILSYLNNYLTKI